MLEKITGALHRFPTTQERKGQERQELENAIGNLKFAREHILSDPQVQNLLEINNPGLIILSSGEPEIIIASRHRNYGGIDFHPAISRVKSGSLGLFVDFSRKFGKFVEIDEISLKDDQDYKNLLALVHPGSDIVHRLGILTREEIVEKIKEEAKKAKQQPVTLLEGLSTA